MMKERPGLLDYSASAGPAAKLRDARHGWPKTNQRGSTRAAADRAILERALHIWIQSRTKPARIADSSRIQDLFRWKHGLTPLWRYGLAPLRRGEIAMPALGIGGPKGSEVSHL
jgi:hypothetical protein